MGEKLCSQRETVISLPTSISLLSFSVPLSRSIYTLFSPPFYPISYSVFVNHLCLLLSMSLSPLFTYPLLSFLSHLTDNRTLTFLITFVH